MTKNAIIGLLAAVVIIGGIIVLTNNSSGSPATSTTTTKQTSGSDTTPTPTVTHGTPLAVTSQNFSPSNSTVTLTGQVTPNGAQTNYWFEYGQTTGIINRTPQQGAGSGFSPVFTPAFVTGLQANTTYTYRLVASNNFGVVYGSTYSFETNSSPAPRAANPDVSTKSATAVARTTVNINGQINPNGFQTNYWFEYGKDSNFGDTTSITSVTNNNAITGVTEPLVSLDPATKYYFRLDAENQFGTVIGNTLNFTTSGPVNPGAPSVTTTSASSIANSGVQLNGRINTNGADTTYWFEYSQDSLLGNIIGNGTSMKTLSAGTNTVNAQTSISGLARNSKYYYRLVARNQYGTIYGDIVSFTTKS